MEVLPLTHIAIFKVIFQPIVRVMYYLYTLSVVKIKETIYTNSFPDWYTINQLMELLYMVSEKNFLKPDKI